MKRKDQFLLIVIVRGIATIVGLLVLMLMSAIMTRYPGKLEIKVQKEGGRILLESPKQGDLPIEVLDSCELISHQKSEHFYKENLDNTKTMQDIYKKHCKRQ